MTKMENFDKPRCLGSIVGLMYPRRSWAQRTNAMENLRERKKWSYFKTPPAVAHHGPVHVHR